jgi:hypothetical protein
MNYFLSIHQYTWRRKDRSQASRIDLILIGTYFINLVAFCKIKPTVKYTAQAIGERDY